VPNLVKVSAPAEVNVPVVIAVKVSARVETVVKAKPVG
jgi:hypothetical protein